MAELIDKDFDEAFKGILQPKVPVADEEFDRAFSDVAAESKSPDEKFDAAFEGVLKFNKERRGAPEEEQPESEPVIERAGMGLIVNVPEAEEGIRKFKDGVVRGFRGGFNAGFWRKMKGAYRLMREASDEDAPTLLGSAPFRLLNMGVDYLVEKFGGDKEGALELMERRMGAFEDYEGAVSGPSDPSAGGLISETIGRLPGEGIEFVTALQTGGPLFFGALESVDKAGEQGASELDILQAGGEGAALGMFFKWMDTLVPATPKPSKDIGKPQSELNVNYGPPQKEPSFLNPVERAYADGMRETYALEKAGKVLGDVDLINAARVSVGNAGNSAHFAEFGGFNAVTKQTTGNDGLFRVLKKVPHRQWNGLKDYLVAKRGLELESRGIKSGQDVERMKRIADEGDANPVFTKAADGIYKFQDDVLRYLVDSGVVSEDAYQAILKENKFYIPYFRSGFPEKGLSGKGGKALFAIKGSELTVEDPFRSIMRQTVRLMNMADQNRLVKMLAKNADKPGFETLVKTVPKKPSVAATTNLDEVMRGLGVRPETVEAVKETGLNFAQDIKIFRAGDPKGRGVVEYFEAGEKKFIDIDKDIADAIGAYNLKDGNTFLDNIFTNILSVPSVLLRATATAVNPGFFLVKNPGRDQMTLMMQTKTGAKPGVALIDGIMSFVKRDEAYKMWVRTGGSNSTLVSMDRPQMRRMFRQMMSESNHQNWRDVGELAITPLRAVQELSQMIEAGSRIGEFKTGLRNIGGTVEKGIEQATPAELNEIAKFSRDVTVDFGLKGRSQIAQWIRKTMAFSNPNLQGLDRFIRLHQENPKKAVALGTLLITVPTLAIHALQMQDDEYREKYRRLPNWRKFNFWNIDGRYFGRDDGRLIPIPSPFDWGMAYKAPWEALVSSFMLDDPSLLKRMAEGVGNQSQPFINFDKDGITLSAPTALQPFLDIAGNRRSFFNTPIHTKSELALPSEMRFDERTTRTAQILSEMMEGVFSPKEIEVLVNGYTASIGRTALRASDKIIKPGPFGDVPALRQFGDQPIMDMVFGGLSNRTMEEGASQVVTDFYDTNNETAKLVRGWQELVKRGQAEKARTFLNKHREGIETGLRLSGKNGRGGFASAIAKINQKKRTILRRKEISITEKERLVKNLNTIIDQLASKALGVPQQ